MKTVGSLFSGIGGLDLGLEWAGWQVIWQAETNPYASKILKKHWPDVPNLGDVTEIDWENVRRPDLVCAGFPCQPVSHAGARQGAGDDRWLWPEVLRCVRLVRPGWVLLENVSGLLTLGFGTVTRDLAQLGYDLRWDCIPAAAVGAPHLRYRIFIVAHTDREQLRVRTRNLPAASGTVERGEEERERLRAHAGDGGPPMADADRPRPQGRPVLSERPGQRAARSGSLADTDRSAGRPARTASETVLGSGTVERSGRRSSSSRSHWEFEPDVGRVASRLSLGMDGDINAHAECITQARTKGVPHTARLRTLRNHMAAMSPTPSPERIARCNLCGHPLSSLPCQGACAPWGLGNGSEDTEDLRCLREGVLGLLAHQGEDVQQYLSFGTWTDQRTQEVGERVNRLRCLGNAVVPQVAELVAEMWLP